MISTRIIDLFFILIISTLLNGCSSPSSPEVNLEDVSQQSIKVPLVKAVKEVVAGPQVPEKQTSQDGFVEMANEFGLGNVKATHLYAIHLNNDKYIDLAYLPDFYSIPKFLIYSPILKQFVPVKKPLFEKTIKASFLEFADFNNDGIIDMLGVTFNQKSELKPEPPKLYIGKLIEGTVQFKEHPFDFPIDTFASSLALDVNHDGIMDILFAGWFDTRGENVSIRPNRLFLGKKSKEKTLQGITFQEHSGLFENEWEFSKSTNSYINASPTFGLSACDIDYDGKAEIFNANSAGYPNKLWQSVSVQKRSFFRDIAKNTQIAGDSIGSHLPKGGGHTFYQSCIDYNLDGFIDVAVGELFHSYDLESKDRSSILTKSSHKFPLEFIRTEYHQDDGTESWDQGDRRGFWADIDNDGLFDLIIDNSGFPPKSRLVIFKQHSDHSFEDVAKSWGMDHLNPSGSIFLDVNGDGKMDILSGQSRIRNSKIKNRIYLYINHKKIESKNASMHLHFGSLSRGKMIKVTDANGAVRTFPLEVIGGPQSSQNQNLIMIHPYKAAKLKNIEFYDKKGSKKFYNLKKFRSNQVSNNYRSIELWLCGDKLIQNSKKSKNQIKCH